MALRGRTGVAHTVGVTRTVNVAVVPVVGLVLDVCRVDSDTTGLLLWRLVDAGIVGERSTTLRGENLGNGSSKCCLSVVDVACTK